MSPGCSPPNAKPERLTGLPGKGLLKEMGRKQEASMQYSEAKKYKINKSNFLFNISA